MTRFATNVGYYNRIELGLVIVNFELVVLFFFLEFFYKSEFYLERFLMS
jgi:hypothetical protein